MAVYGHIWPYTVTHLRAWASALQRAFQRPADSSSWVDAGNVHASSSDRLYMHMNGCVQDAAVLASGPLRLLDHEICLFGVQFLSFSGSEYRPIHQQLR